MKILHLDKNKKWVSVQKKTYNDEAQLQNLLTKDIDVLPLDEIGYDTKFVAVGKEVGLQNGALDVLAVSPQGHIVLIETKLEKNPEVKRTVVGQILGYAAYLWNKSYQDLESYFKKFLIQEKIDFQGTLFEYIQSKLEDNEISETEFKEGLEKRLRLGSFTLLIVVDQINQELKDIANYLNDRTGQEIDFYVVEMELVGDKEEQFLVPRLANPPRKNITFSSEKAKSTDSYSREPITKEELLVKLSDSGKKLANALLNKFENDPNISLTWRKNGFSIQKQISKNLLKGQDVDYKPSFSFFFLFAKENEKENINFAYPEGAYESFRGVRPTVSDFINYYRSLPGYDKDKKIIEDLSIFNDKRIKEFIELIKKTADKLKE